MGYSHEGIVHYNHEVVCGSTVGSHDYEVVKLAVGIGNLSLYEVLKHGLPFGVGLKTNDGLHPFPRFSAVSAPSVVLGDTTLLLHLFSYLFKLLRGAVAVVGLSFLYEPFSFSAIYLHPVRLTVWTLVPIYPQPFQRFNDLLYGLFGGAGSIGIFNS